MTLSNYCYKKGFTLDQYETLKSNITSICTAIISQIPQNKKGHGMYYDVIELLPYNMDAELRPFYIMGLKAQGVEFYNDNSEWRI